MTPEAGLETSRVATRHGHVFYRTAGTGPPLLLLHATPKSSRSYAGLIPHLTDHHRVIAADTLGFGESDPLPPTPTLPILAESMADLLGELDATLAAVFGLHTGNKIGTALSADHPAQVSCFILCGMTHSIILDRMAREAAIKTLVATPFNRTDISEDEKLDRQQGAASVDRIYEANYDFDLSACLPRIKAPTLVLELATPEEEHLGLHAESVAASIPKGAAHTFFGSDRDALEKRPDALAQLILNFTSTHQGSSVPSK